MSSSFPSTGDAPRRALQTPARAPTAASPCIKVCRLDAEDRCYGCGRSRAEIAGWSTMSVAERQAVNARLGFRGHDGHR
jgi:predicted Fe-S protein YdhL (DUF1289 family)